MTSIFGEEVIAFFLNLKVEVFHSLHSFWKMEMTRKMVTPPSGQSFFKIMIGDFSKEMLVPRSFQKHFNGHSLGQSITITSSNGDSWTVKLEKDGNDLCFRDGWENLVNDLYVQKYDFLIFKRNGESEFDVAVYCKDGCEITHWNVDDLISNAEQLTHGVYVKFGEKYVSVKEAEAARVPSSFFSKNVYFVVDWNISKTNYLIIPKSVVRRKGLISKTSTTLCDPSGDLWPVILQQWGDGRVTMATGWLDFCRGNNLAADDITLVFEFGSGGVVHVQIFRERDGAFAETGRKLQIPPKESSFCKVMVEDFSKEMLIPYAFIENFHGNLLHESILRSPTGGSWTVQVEEDGDDTFFRGGWKKFVKDQSLGTNDFLVFRYSGDSQFDFKVYGENGCEKNIVLPSMNSVDPRPNAKKVSQNREKPTTYDESSNRVERETDRYICVQINRKRAGTRPTNCTPEPEGVAAEEADAEERKTSNSRGSGYRLQYVSNRRPVTDSEKEKAFQLAQAESTNESFIVVMRPTHVYKRFYLRLRSEWADRRISLQNQDVILVYREKTWVTRFNLDGRGGGGLSGGWKGFALENNLEEFDVCRFDLDSPAGNTIVMNVSIFRALEELTPLTRVSPASPPSRKLSKIAPKQSL